MDKIDEVVLKLLSRAKHGTLSEEDPELLTFANLTHIPTSKKPIRIRLNTLQIAARHGHLDQVPKAVLERLALHEQTKLKQTDEYARQHKAAVKRGEDVPF
jgi:hypothetical protein